MKVATLVGTRPEIIKLSRVIALLDEHTEHVLVHTGQNFDRELSQIFFDDLGIPEPDYYLAAAGTSAAETTGQVIVEVARRAAGSRRHQQRPRHPFGQATSGSDLSHGSGKQEF